MGMVILPPLPPKPPDILVQSARMRTCTWALYQESDSLGGHQTFGCCLHNVDVFMNMYYVHNMDVHMLVYSFHSVDVLMLLYYVHTVDVFLFLYYVHIVNVHMVM